MNLLILTPEDRIGEGHFRIRGSTFKHIREILKPAVGDDLKAGLIDGPIGKATIVEIQSGHLIVTFEKDESELMGLLDRPVVDLICALPRPQTVKKLLVTAGTWGVRRLNFVRAKRVEKSYYHSPLLAPENMRPFLLEGMSQGKSTRLPQVNIHNRFRPFFEDTLPSRLKNEDPIKLLPHPNGAANLMEVIRPSVDHLLVAIGPEGGWIDFELEFMQSRGFCPFSLGHPILRVEDAATSALAQIEVVCSQKKSG